MNDERLLVGPRDAAKLLSVSERTLWTLTREKKIESRKIGRLVRYSSDELKRFATECR
ncbi:MAG: helix-turn-helix domain-containing protein [Pirellulales bacterium]|nr:helix-turn-helix domain-containing protein [Pirellulales bacterium]